MQTSSTALARSITRTANGHADATIRLLVDRRRTADAYRAYAYFRWVDDRLDLGDLDRPQALAFLARQRALIAAAYQGQAPSAAAPQEEFVLDLIRRDPSPESGLGLYVSNMMEVMAFDAERRGRLISAQQLDSYTRCLAIAVTEALHYFIGHRTAPPRSPARYLAASGAHIAHMLRDTDEDLAHGYFNIPREVLASGGIAPTHVESDAYRDWARDRVFRARRCLRLGRTYLAQVESLRWRIAGYAYAIRFERCLDSIERSGFCPQPDDPPDRAAGGEFRTFLAASAAALRRSERSARASSKRDVSPRAGRSVEVGPP